MSTSPNEIKVGNPLIMTESMGKPGNQWNFGNGAGCHIMNDDGGIGCYFDDRTRCPSYITTAQNSIPFDQLRKPPEFTGTISDWRREAVTFLFKHTRKWLLVRACEERARIKFEKPDITIQVFFLCHTIDVCCKRLHTLGVTNVCCIVLDPLGRQVERDDTHFYGALY